MKLSANFYWQVINCMPQMYQKQPGFTYCACGPFTRNKERIKKFMQTGNTDSICRNKLNKSCF